MLMLMLVLAPCMQPVKVTAETTFQLSRIAIGAEHAFELPNGLQVLRGDIIGTLLLSCHQQLSKAKHARHAGQALAPFKALLLLLGDAVTVPSTFRYATTILLQQLHSRWANKRNHKLVLSHTLKHAADAKDAAAVMATPGCVNCWCRYLHVQSSLHECFAVREAAVH